MKQPSVMSRVHPKILYSLQELNTKLVKVNSPYEYLHYIRRRQEYIKKQQQLLYDLNLNHENFEKLSFSVKQIGVTDQQGKIGVQSQRRYLIKSMETATQQPFQQAPLTERVSYQFKGRALQSTKREKQFSRESPSFNFFTIPERPHTLSECKSVHIDKIIKQSRLKKQRQQNPSSPEVVFQNRTNQKYSSYSRQLQELSGTLDMNKLI